MLYAKFSFSPLDEGENADIPVVMWTMPKLISFVVFFPALLE